MNSSNYRKIYEDHFGPIPKDNNGRSYEIHHIDGNRNNNSPDNLIALSIEDHYNVHYEQGDWIACSYIARYRLGFSKEHLSNLARMAANERVSLGTNPFQKRSDGSSLASDRVKNGTHNLTKRNDGTSVASERIKNGTHICLKKGREAPRYDHRIFRFYNQSMNIIEECSQYELVLKYPYLKNSKGNLSSLVNNKNNVSIVKGWRKID